MRASRIRRFVRVLRFPALVALPIHLLWAVLACSLCRLTTLPVAGVLQLTAVLSLIALTGWRVTRRASGGLGMAALSGPIVLLMVIAARMFYPAYVAIARPAGGPDPDTQELFLLGVFISVVICSPLAALIAVAGGIAGRPRDA